MKKKESKPPACGISLGAPARKRKTKEKESCLKELTNVQPMIKSIQFRSWKNI